MVESEKTGIFYVDPSMVDMIPIGNIKPYKRNAKKHPQEQIEQIINSINAFGMNDPIGVWGEDNVIVEGHGRYLALKEMGESGLVPVIHLDNLTDEQRKAYALAHNKLTMNTDFDFDALSLEMDELSDFFDMSDFGFETDAEQEEQKPTEVTEDDFDETTVTESVCKRGQIWQLGDHRLMCGDSTNADDVATLMNGEKADMVFTDPPYGVDYASKNKYLNAISRGNRIQVPIENDALSSAEEEKEALWIPAFTNAFNNATDRCSYYVTSPQGGELMMMMMMMAIRESGWLLKHTLIWNKNNHVLGRSDYNYKHEPILYGWKKQHDFYGKGKFKTSVWDIPKPQKSDLHPTMKPVELVAECEMNSSKEGDVILDLFGGSGTTLIASEQLCRICRMMEYDPHYCDVIIKRWEDFTGQEAVLIEE